MKPYWITIVMGVVALLYGCNDTETIQPEARGQRGESCRARNDCESGLACIGGVCSKNDFDIAPTARQCDQVDCQQDVDCCGDQPMQAPPKCANRTSICETPTLTDCTQTTCSADGDCGSGVCGAGFCSNDTLVTCTGDADCVDECSGEVCTISAGSCTTSEDCTAASGTCESRICDCTNPEYDPTDPICTDPDCEDVCTLRCEEERCVEDTSCEADAECLAFGLSICNQGRCVQCTENADCDTDNDEQCVDNFCERPCTENEECPLFHECQQGDCVETGCTSDRECILAVSQTGTTEDARLAQCLPSDPDPDINICKVPCENDGECSQFEVCEAGFCKFVGCETNEECRSFLGLQNQTTTDDRPFVSKAVCRE